MIFQTDRPSGLYFSKIITGRGDRSLTWITNIVLRNTKYKEGKLQNVSKFRKRFGGSFPSCQRSRKFRPEMKWKGPSRFLPTGICGITSGDGPEIPVRISRPNYRVSCSQYRSSVTYSIHHGRYWEHTIFFLLPMFRL